MGEEETGFWWGNMRERDDLKDRGINGRMMLNGYEVTVWKTCTALFWLRTGKIGRLL
jgi:hypothetical protein